MNKRKMIAVIVMMVFMLLPACAQEIETKTLYVNKAVKADRPLIEKYGGSLHCFIRLDLPDIEKSPKAYRKALTAVRDTVVSRALGVKYQKGDKDYQKTLALFEAKELDNLEEMIEFMDEDSRAGSSMLFRWMVEFSGMPYEPSTDDPTASAIPFFQFFLQKIEFIGNSWYVAQNLVFDKRTGQLLTIADLLDKTTDGDDVITELMRKKFSEQHPNGTDYDYHVNSSASFEVSKDGISFYIPTDEVLENQLEYILLERDVLKPYIKKGSLLEKYWSTAASH